MSISGIGQDTSALYSINPLQSQTSVSGTTDPDGDGDGSATAVQGHRRGGHHHGGGEVGRALAQALQSLGLNLNPSPSSNSANAGTDADGDSDGSTANHGQIQSDMRHFLHALFDAVRSDSSSSTGGASSTATGSNGNPASSFSSGLASLISQVGSGNAPAGLQKAFDQLAADLQGTGATSSASSTTTGSTTADTGSSSTTTSSSSNNAVTLQALLTAMQSQFNTYGQSQPSSSSSGLLATA